MKIIFIYGLRKFVTKVSFKNCMTNLRLQNTIFLLKILREIHLRPLQIISNISKQDQICFINSWFSHRSPPMQDKSFIVHDPLRGFIIQESVQSDRFRLNPGISSVFHFYLLLATDSSLSCGQPIFYGLVVGPLGVGR